MIGLNRTIATGIIGGIFGFLFLVMSTSVYGSLGMKPQIKELKASRGGWSEFNFTVTNHGNEAMSLVMLAEDMDVTPEGQAFKANPDFKRGCANWITFALDTFALEGGQSQEIHIRIKVPKDATGSYFAIVRCMESEAKNIDLPKTETSSGALGMNVGVGALVFITAQGSQNTATLKPDTVYLNPGKTGAMGPVVGGENNGWELDVSLFNAGNIYTQAWGEVSIYTQAGRLVEKADLTAGHGYIFPERPRLFTAQGSRPLADGGYLVRTNFYSKEGKSGRGTYPFTIVNGVAHLGIESEDLYALVKASSPGFSLSERFLDFDVMPGSNRTKGLSIYNDRKDTLVMIPQRFNWVTDSKGTITLISARDTTYEHSCATWIELNPDTIEILPGMRKDVRVSISAPQELDGEYYAGIRFDTKDLKENLPTEFQMPSALLVAASAKRTLKYSAIIKSVEKKKTDQDGCVFEVKFENNGNVHCYANGDIEIYGAKNEKIGEPAKFGSKDEFVFPGVIRTYTVPFQETFDAGPYTAYVRIGYQEKTKSLLETVSFQIK